MKRIILALLIIFICNTVDAKFCMAQDTFTAIVVDSVGKPVAGAVVIFSNSRKGCITDINGKFSIAIPKNSEKESLKIVGIGIVTKVIKCEDLYTYVNKRIVIANEAPDKIKNGFIYELHSHIPSGARRKELEKKMDSVKINPKK